MSSPGSLAVPSELPQFTGPPRLPPFPHCSLLDFLLVNVSYVTTSKFPIGIRGFCLRSPSFSPNMTLLNFHPPYIGLVLLHNSHHLSNSYEVPDLVLTNVPTFAFF